MLKAYGCVSVTGDNYAGEWPVSYFRQRGIDYHKAEKAKSELYLAMIPAVNSKQVELPDNRQLIDELRKLERRRGRTGKDTIDHPANGHDDIANAAAGVCWLILSDALGDESLGGFHPGRHVTSDALRVRGPIYIGLSLEPFTAAVAQLGNGDTLQFLHAVLGPALHSVLRELQTWLNLHARMVKRTGIYPETEDWHLMEQIEAAMPGVWQVSCAGEDGARQRLLKALDEYNPLGEPRLTISRGVRFLPEALARKHDKGTPLSALAYAAALVVDHVNPGAPPPGPPLTVNTYFNPTAPYDPRRRGW